MTQRGATLLEVMVVAVIMLALAAAFALPAYRDYARSRETSDAATRLAEDLEYLSRIAQNGVPNEGASLIVESDRPLSYRGYLGRPAGEDPRSSLRQVLLERTFPDVSLEGGRIGPGTPLLFADNGSAQYEVGGLVASQHQTVTFVLDPTGSGKSASVGLNLFTGAVTAAK